MKKTITLLLCQSILLTASFAKEGVDSEIIVELTKSRTSANAFLQNQENIRQYLEWLGSRKGFNTLKDWYQLTSNDLLENHANTLKVNYTRWELVEIIFPNQDVLPWKFKNPKGYFKKDENKVRYLKWLGKMKHFETLDDWYKIRPSDFIENDAKNLITTHSLPELVTLLFPEEEVLTWKFKGAIFNLWQDESLITRYLNWLGKELDYKSLEDWYSLQSSDLINNYGKSLAKMYSRDELVKRIFPDQEVLPWKFTHNYGVWDNTENIRWYLKWLSEKTNISLPKDLAKLKRNLIEAHYGRTLLDKYETVNKILKVAYPEEDIKEWNSKKSPNGLWNKKENVRNYLEDLKKKLNYDSNSDLYKLTRDDFIENNGNGLIQTYGQIIKLLRFAYPEEEWHEWLFTKSQASFFDNIDNVKRYIEWLSSKLGYIEIKDWYSVTSEDFKKNGGDTLLKKHGGIHRVLKMGYPNFEWKPWLFNRAPEGFWTSAENRKKYLQHFEVEWNFKSKEDWYIVSYEQLHRGLTGEARNSVTVIDIILEAFPKYNLDRNKFVVFKSQYRLRSLVEELFPGERVLYNYKSPYRFKKTNRQMEIDIFLPGLNIGFEFQGRQHYEAIDFFGGEEGFQKQMRRDREKRLALRMKGITLIEIPYTWDSSLQYVESEILDAYNIDKDCKESMSLFLDYLPMSTSTEK